MENFFNEELYLNDLKSKFLKIVPNDYYLSYSGGKDSHFIYWFLTIWLKENDKEMYLKYKDIKIVGVNTYMEHQEILKRIQNNCDVVLKPKLKPFEIKVKYGSPCFSKNQDDKIDRYQKGLRSDTLLKFVYRTEPSRFNLNLKASTMLLNGELHKVSPKCCKYLKKIPLMNYGKQTGKKSILGVRGSEGITRKAKYTSCFTKNGNFTPLWDLTDELLKKIYDKYNIEIPKIYDYLIRTGCMGCPYGNNIEKELLFVTPNQYKFLWEYHKESYEVLCIKHLTEEERQSEFKKIKMNQLTIFDFIKE